MKKFIAVFTASILFLNTLMPVIAMAEELVSESAEEVTLAAEPFVEGEQGYYSVKNGMVEYRVNKENGRYSIHTTDGIPDKASDNDKNLLFFGKTPDTSFTTIRIDGKDYIFGDRYDEDDGGLISLPSVDGKITTTVWRIGDIYVTQRLQLVIDESNPNAGNTKVTYTLVNRGKKAVSADARILLDTQLGSNDASPMIVGSTFITNEIEFEGEYVPTAWKSADERFAPNIIAYGLTGGWENIEPTRMIVAHWENLGGTMWDYTPDPYLNFTTDKNDFGGADSAVALYYEGSTLSPGEELVFETYYGIGSIADAAVDANFNLQVNVPSKLTVNNSGTGYNEKEIEVVVTIDNTGEKSVDLDNVAIQIGMDEVLSLASGETPSHVIRKIVAGDKTEVVFKIVPYVQSELTVAELGITVLYGDEDAYTEARKYIILPSVKGNPPKMQMTEISPTVLYKDTVNKTFLIKGSDFDSLKADYDWTMQIVSEATGEEYLIKRKDITITNDSLSIKVDKDYKFNEGEHQIVIRSNVYGNMSKSFEFSSDIKYDRKEFGLLVIGNFPIDENGNTKYTALTFKGERDIPESIKDKILLKIKGDIFEQEINEEIIYECGPGSIINDAILYSPPNNEKNKCFNVKRYKEGGVDWWGLVKDSLAVTGTGFLSIGDYRFHFGDFYIVFNDDTEYALAERATHPSEEKDEEKASLSEDGPSLVEIITPQGVVAKEVLKTVGFLVGTDITIKNAVIGTNTVSLGGSIAVALPWLSDASKDDDDDEDDKKDDDKPADGDNSGNQGGDDNSGSQGGDNSGNQGGDNSGNQGGDNSGNQGGDNSGNQGGDNSGNQGGDNSGNQGGDNSGSQGGDNSGNQGGDNSGNQGGDDNSGSQGGDNSGNQGGDNSGNQGGDNSGNQGGDNSGNQGGDNSGNQGGDDNSGSQGGGDNSGNQGGDNSGNQGGDDNSGSQGGDNSGNQGGDDNSGSQGGDNSGNQGGDNSGNQGGDNSGSQGGGNDNTQGGGNDNTQGGENDNTQGGDNNTPEGGDDNKPEGGDNNTPEGGDNNTPEGGDNNTPEGGDDNKPEGGDDNKPEGGDNNTPEGGDNNTPEGGDDNKPEGGDDNKPEGGDNNTPEGGDNNTPEGGDDNKPEGGDDNKPEGGDDNKPEGGDDNKPEGGDNNTPEGGDNNTPEGGDNNTPEGGDDNKPEGGDDNKPEGGDDNKPEGGDDNKPEGGDDNKPEGGDNNTPEGGDNNTPEGGNNNTEGGNNNTEGGNNSGSTDSGNNNSGSTDNGNNSSNDSDSSKKDSSSKVSGTPTGGNKSDKAAKDRHDKNEEISDMLSEGQRTDDMAKLVLEELRYGVTPDNSSYLVGVKAEGEIKLNDDSIPKLKAGGAQASFKMNSLDYEGMYLMIGAGFKVGEAFEAEGKVELVFETGGKCIPDSVELVMGGDVMKIPLGTVGYLTKLGGGVYNLYDQIKDNYNIVPPVTIKLITGYEDPTSVAFEMDTISLELGHSGFRWEGEEAKVVGLKVLEKVYGQFKVYETIYNNKNVRGIDISFGSELDFVGIIKGSSNMWLIYDPNSKGIFGPVSLGGKGCVGIVVPEFIPLIGGIELMGALIELSTTRAFAGVRFIGIPYSVGYYWADKDVKFNDDFGSLASEFGVEEETLENALAIIPSDSNNENSGMMVFGSNMRKTYSSVGEAMLMSDNTRHEIPVLDQDYALFELNYNGNLPSITVTKPDGTNYALVENENYLAQTINSDISMSGTTEQRIYISVVDPMDGTWVIESDTPVDCTANEVFELPELKNVDCELRSDGKLDVEWDATGVDDSYVVDIHISEVGEEYDIADFAGREEEYYRLVAENYDTGIIVAKNIPVNDGRATVEISDRIINGEFKARVVLRKGDENFHSEMSHSTFTYKNPNVPDTPQNVNVTPGGDGQFAVTFDKVDNAQKYSITVLNADGSEIEDYEGVITEKTKAYVGSVASIPTEYDAEMKPVSFKKTGVFPGNSYKVKVCAFNEIDSVTYMSDAYISDEIFLPVPNPATPTIKVDGRLAARETLEHEDNVYSSITNNPDAVVEYSADMYTEVSFIIDGNAHESLYELQAGETLSIPLALLEGGSIMKFTATNSAGDYTYTTLKITLDQTPPTVMLNEATVLAENGVYTITGVAETDTKVYVGNSHVEVPVNGGYFTYTGTLDRTRDSIEVMAVDAAGNETVVLAHAIDNNLSSFEKIIITDENANELDKVTLYRGETKKVCAYGVDADGNTFELDNSNIKYEMFYGSDKATVDDSGIITAEYYGDAILVSSYAVTDSYSFEATLEIAVEQRHEAAKDIRLSALETYNTIPGSIVGRISVPDTPIGVTYTFTVADNEYFEIADNLLVVKKDFNVNSLDIQITAIGKHVINGIYEEIGTPFTKTFTITRVRRVESVTAPASIETYVDKAFDKLPLPEIVEVTLNTGETVNYPVTWNMGAYNPDIPKDYVVKGHIDIPEGIINPTDVTANVIVKVNKAISDLEIDSAHEITYGDKMVFTAQVTKNAASAVLFDEQPDTVFFYNEATGVLLGTADVTYEAGNTSCTAIFEYDTSDRKLAVGDNYVVAHYSGGVKLNGSDSNKDLVRIIPKDIHVNITSGGGVYGETITPVTAEPAGYVDGYKPGLVITYTGTAFGGVEVNTTELPVYVGEYTATVTVPDNYYNLIGKSSTEFVIETTGSTVNVIKAELVDITPEDAVSEKLYEFSLVAENGVINRLNSADITFKLIQKNSFGKNTFEIIDIGNDNISLNPVNNSDTRYEFHFDTKDVNNDTGISIPVCRIRITGYGEFEFGIDETVTTNTVHTTKVSDNIVDTYIPNGLAKGYGDFETSAKVSANINIPTSKLAVNISFPNAVVNNKTSYQQMKLRIYGGDLEKDIVIDLGTDTVLPDIATDMKPDAKITMKNMYSLEFTGIFTDYTSYNVELSGYGYRTARYTVNMQSEPDGKILHFWNNVKDNLIEVEEGKPSSKTNVTFLAGDVVKDNQINIYDLSALVSYFATTITDKADYEKYIKYDLNRDGKIDSKDVAYILVSWGF